MQSTNTSFCSNMHQYVLRNAGDGEAKCPVGTEVIESECLDAAKTFSSVVDIKQNYDKGQYDFTPCGCYLWKNSYKTFWHANYDSGGEGCESHKNGRLICMREKVNTESCSYFDDRHDYRGKINVTKGGYTCQRWDSQSPHTHKYNTEDYPYAGLEENYCRNPDGESRPWCITTDHETGWYAWCDIPSCLEEKFDFYPMMDSPGSDIKKSDGGSTNGYARECITNPECLGFNSNGWLKCTISNQSEWLKWTDDPSQGLYVKKNMA